MTLLHNSQRMGKWLMLLLCHIYLPFSTPAQKLNCNNTQELINFLHSNHYAPQEISPQWGKTVTTDFIETIDPKRLIFLQEDVNQLKDAFIPDSSSTINQAACEFLPLLLSIYKERLQSAILTIEKTTKHPFTYNDEETITFIPKKENSEYPSTPLKQTNR